MHEDSPPSQPAPAPYSPPAGPRSSLPPPYVVPPPRRHLGWAVWVLLLSIMLLIMPTLAERVEYAITRGRVNAEADATRDQLGEPHDVTLADYPKVVKAMQPSVVGVKATQVVNGEPPDERSYLLRRRPRMFQQDQGSGVIVDEAGYIITNFHVVGQSTDITVELSDGSHAKAKVVGTDSATDLAVLKIDAPGLRHAAWGDSDRLEVGDPVMAIGNPFGLARTVTAGIISAKGRHGVIGDVTYQDFLQTDAAVNPGSSGGPLVNMKAQVVGINTAIYGPTYQGVSFAIPSNLAQPVYEKLKRGEKVTRGWLGVAMQELTPELAEQLHLKSTNGALVANVVPRSPAAQAGLKPGDVIVRWDDKPINDPSELSMAVAWCKIGSEAKVVVIRDGKETTLTVKVGEPPANLR